MEQFVRNSKKRTGPIKNQQVKSEAKNKRRKIMKI
jgi:hypothetical protein